jgi:hypothetical protein
MWNSQGPNLSTSGLPKGRGQKGGRPKRQRSRSTTPAPDNYSIRPGLVSITGTAGSGSITQAPVSSSQQPVSVTLYACSATSSVPVFQHPPRGVNTPGHAVTFGPPPLINVTEQKLMLIHSTWSWQELSGSVRVVEEVYEQRMEASQGPLWYRHCTPRKETISGWKWEPLKPLGLLQ